MRRCTLTSTGTGQRKFPPPAAVRSPGATSPGVRPLAASAPRPRPSRSAPPPACQARDCSLKIAVGPDKGGEMEGEVRFHHIAPDLWVLEARRCAHRWVVFHETYSFCLVRRFLSSDPRVGWRYNHRLYLADPERLIM